PDGPGERQRAGPRRPGADHPRLGRAAGDPRPCPAPARRPRLQRRQRLRRQTAVGELAPRPRRARDAGPGPRLAHRAHPHHRGCGQRPARPRAPRAQRVAATLPVHPLRHHLRRVQRDPTQHHLRARARTTPTGQAVMTEHKSPLAVVPEETPGHGLLKGKQVVVTAAAGHGIGSPAARRAALAAEFPEQQFEAITCNVQSTSDVDALITGAADTLGRIDVLINNAGLGGECELVDMSDEDWDRVLDITLNGTFRATRAALRYFRDVPHGGVIVNNASVLGWRAQRAQAHYAAAKAGVMALTRSSAIEGADHGVR